ncbi:hypothetical protein [Acaryochloris marina]|uniref:hypothetical protein n=1 Tax=Acaryochloris marina TaxID=155978 RepID=UPI001BAE72CC|nr:hypothetical protein [Acaryochloris marina]QUY46252.1 hypothetical protein I1H34_31585 [Acaryochloris marina S15]
MATLTTEELEQWISHYFENPQPNKTPIAIGIFIREGYFTNDSIVETVITFLSFIFRDQPDKISIWLNSIQDLSNQEMIAIGKALWLSNTKEAKNYLDAILKKKNKEIQESLTLLLREVPPKIEEIPISSPSILDMLWAAFAATGEEKYVTRLMSVLPYINAEDEPHLFSIGNAARWSLRSNMDKYEKIKSICVNQLEQQSQEISIILKEILAETD